MLKRVRLWLIKQLIRSGKWFVYRKTTPAGSMFQLVDMQRHISCDWVLAHEMRENEWLII